MLGLWRPLRNGNAEVIVRKDLPAPQIPSGLASLHLR